MADEPLSIEDIRKAARFEALYWIVHLILARQFANSGNPEVTADGFSTAAKKALDQATGPGLDPAMSDLYAQECRDFSLRIVQRALALATGKPPYPQMPQAPPS